MTDRGSERALAERPVDLSYSRFSESAVVE